MLNNVEERDNIITYERKIRSMEEENKKDDSQTAPPKETDKKNISILRVIEVIGIIVGITGGITTLIMTRSNAEKEIYIPLTQNTDAISQMQESLDDIKEDIGELSDDIKELSKIVYVVNGRAQGYSSGYQMAEAIKLEFEKEYVPNANYENDDTALAKLEWKKTVYVATDEHGNQYTPLELCNTAFVTSYIQDGKEVYFLGQYNEKNHWNGRCILNVYYNGNLEYIFDAIYNDGDLYSYQRLSDEKDGTWKVTDRTVENDYKDGETWVYIKSGNYKQEISLNEYDESLILNFDNFSDYKDEKLLSYYSGRTSNGSYNDDTGKAYLISYFEDGEIKGAEDKAVIKTLYKGCFVDGEFKDDETNSWYITREPDTTYMYFQGGFSDGTANHEKEIAFENYLTKERINELLKEKNFEEYKDGFYVEY